ncbi:MAG: dual specificity protein phosphatase family protein [Deltaproteobacteria bacterium]|nr:dual specificity protein phosphatase family protein [Deltaproteobacteria bacterium]
MDTPEARAGRVIAMSTLRWTALLFVTDLAVWGYAVWLYALGLPVISLLLAWSALSLLVVTGLYGWACLGHNPGPWMADAMPWWARPVLWPFRLVAWSLMVVLRRVRGASAAPTEVCEGLWLGMHPATSELEILLLNKVHGVIDLCAELQPVAQVCVAPFERLSVPVLDRCVATQAELNELVMWALAQRAQGRAVYVHCAFGRGRSAMVAAVLLLAMGEARDCEEALARVKAKRPSVSVKGDQRLALERWYAAKSLAK